MSCYETHKGVLKRVNTQGTDMYTFIANAYCLKNNITELPEYLNDEDAILDIVYDTNENWLVLNDTLYEWVNHERKFDEEEDICNLSENPDGSINVFAQFYNRSYSIEEIIEDNFDKKIKTNNSELSADEMINLACKWLDYHHSNYITDTFSGKLIVHGGCQTDLRAFLKKTKTMDYWDAIDEAKK